MYAEGTSLVIVCLVIGVEIYMLKRNVQISNVMYLNVTRDILEHAFSGENTEDASFLITEDIGMLSLKVINLMKILK